jgi:hypothetical protein
MAYTTIDDPSAYFQTKLYTGNNTDGTQITNDGNSNLQPDWLWIKNRTDAGSAPATGGLWDSVRGFAENKVLTTFSTNVEGANSNGFAVATTNGFTVEDGTSGGNPRTATNLNAKNYVAWQWKAGTTSSISGGSITPAAVSINATSGFGIYSYTGTGSNGTIAHGLGTAPKFIVTKNRDSSSYGWYVYHVGIGATKNLYLHNSDEAVTSSTRWNDTAPTSTLFTLGTNAGVNGSSDNMIAYAFSEVKGYSKFGSYTGNGNDDGTFVYLGFKPAWLLIKITDTQTDNWILQDNKRNTSNLSSSQRLRANSNGAEFSSSNEIDLLSNGFKCHGADGEINGSGASYIYLAFAESPFVTAGTKAAGTAR